MNVKLHRIALVMDTWWFKLLTAFDRNFIMEIEVVFCEVTGFCSQIVLDVVGFVLSVDAISESLWLFCIINFMLH